MSLARSSNKINIELNSVASLKLALLRQILKYHDNSPTINVKILKQLGLCQRGLLSKSVDDHRFTFSPADKYYLISFNSQ